MDTKFILRNFLGDSELEGICTFDQFVRDCPNEIPVAVKQELYDALREQRNQAIESVTSAVDGGLQPSKQGHSKIPQISSIHNANGFSLTTLMGQLDAMVPIYSLQERAVEDQINSEYDNVSQKVNNIPELCHLPEDQRWNEMRDESKSVEKCLKLTST